MYVLIGSSSVPVPCSLALAQLVESLIPKPEFCSSNPTKPIFLQYFEKIDKSGRERSSLKW